MIKLTDDKVREIVDQYLSYYEESKIDMADTYDEWQQWNDLYDAQPDVEVRTTPWRGSSNLVVSLVGTYVDVVVARVLGSVFASEPLWVFNQVNADWADHAKAVERYLDVCRKGRLWDQEVCTHEVVLEMCKLGTGGFVTEYVDTQYMKVNEQSTSKQDALIPDTHVVGPKVSWIPRIDFFIPTGFTDVQNAPWVAHRRWYSWPEFQQLINDGQLSYEYVETKSGADENVIEQYDGDQPRRHSNDNTNEITIEGTMKMLEIVYFWSNDDLDEDGYSEPYMMGFHFPTRSLLKFRANPYHRGNRPYKFAPFVLHEGHFDGRGLPWMLEHYQEEVTTIHNQRIDNAHISNTAMIKATAGSGVKNEEKIYPGRTWIVPQLTDIDAFTIGRPHESTMPDEQLTIALAEKRIGISDMSLGRESSPIGRAAATTTMALLQENARRFDLNIKLLRKAIAGAGDDTIEAWRTHGLPTADNPLSPESVIGAKDGALVRAFVEAPLNDLGCITLSLNVSTAAINREIEKQGTLQMQDVLTKYIQQMLQLAEALANPMTPPAFKELLAKAATAVDKQMQKILDAQGVYDMDSILMGDILEQMAMQPPVQPHMAVQPPMPPGGVPMGAAPNGTPSPRGTAPNPTALQ